ncbi:unnamed protein product [Porites evermanni]|uniref:Uncharacterized protein n=1 Tax=Porites evermanni TaxID=104178 RepID=A0ABN8MMY1_9CNID|nr:unnamed protein product [Porites evermanni]
MKSVIAVCVVAVAIATFTIPAEAQSSSTPASQPGVITLATESPSRMPPPNHGCNCKKTCEAVQHSQVPYKRKDEPNYLSYESYPVLCRDAAARFLAPLGGEEISEKYICKQTFDCCRKCNSMFYTCLSNEDPFGACMRAAYKCMCRCIDKSNKELPYKK